MNHLRSLPSRQDQVTADIEASVHMKAITFDDPRIPSIPRARMVGRFALLLAFAALCGPSPGLAVPLLGAAESFVILGGSSVTNTGATSINGNLGISTGTSITGSATSINGDPGVSTGTSNTGATSINGNLGISTGTSITGSATSPGSLHNSPPDDVTSQRAQAADIIANSVLNALPCALDETEIGLSGLTLTPRVDCSSTTARLNGTLTQIAMGDPNAPFVLQIGSGLTTGASPSLGTPEAVVDVIDGDSTTGMFRQVGSGREDFGSLGFSDGFENFADAGAPDGIGFSLIAAPSAALLPEPSTLALLGFGLAGFGLAKRRQVPAFRRITSSA
jgi:hypothetical protein